MRASTSAVSAAVLLATLVLCAQTASAEGTPPSAAGPIGFDVSLRSSIVPGTVDTGIHCDDCTTPITFPFPVSFHGSTYTSVVGRR